ncbi:MAG TPA: zinc ribbon domain-containing protein [Thermoanaerobaculia bacterium]|nr:zinc ribbon domain-containing protein [Thermoanaerobaculia bacterium]
MWNPGADALRCPYCGTVRALPTTPSQVTERPIEEGLRAPRDLGWGTERKTVACPRCGARESMAPGQRAAACAFCGTPAVVETPVSGDMIRPAGLLPFRLDKARAAETFRRWLSGLWFRPNDLYQRAELTGLQGVYVPFWSFDAATHSAWEAEAGYRRAGGRADDIRWEPASGFLELFLDDVLVPASKGLDAALSAEIEPFPTKELAAYDPSFLSGFLAEETAVDLPAGLKAAGDRMAAQIRAACVRQIPGQTYRKLKVRTQYTDVAFKNALLPVWIAAYDYRGRPFRFLVNGVTGKVAGHAPLSWVKVGLAVLAFALFFYLVKCT